MFSLYKYLLFLELVETIPLLFQTTLDTACHATIVFLLLVPFPKYDQINRRLVLMILLRALR